MKNFVKKITCIAMAILIASACGTFTGCRKKVVNTPEHLQIKMYKAGNGTQSIKDVAKITKDGAVVGGNKIKMGLPVTLESEKYKFNGTISDVKVTSDIVINDDGVNTDIG